MTGRSRTDPTTELIRRTIRSNEVGHSGWNELRGRRKMTAPGVNVAATGVSGVAGGQRHHVKTTEKQSLFHSLFSGISALGLALGLERGASFLANVLAARLG